MRLTTPLLKYHLGRLIKQHWYAHGKHIPFDTRIGDVLAKNGIQVLDPKDVIVPIRPKHPRVDLSFDKFLYPPPQAMDQTHPDWHENACWDLNENELLVEGVEQAQALTKTIMIKEGLPEKLENLVEETTPDINKIIERTIYSSNIFDAEQKKLPKVKDPSRPAWVFPRQYGITHVKRSLNLTHKMLHICESLCGPQFVRERQLLDDALVRVPLYKDGNLMLINMKIDMLMTSRENLRPVAEVTDQTISDITIPTLYPMISTVGLLKKNIYQPTNIYPIAKESRFVNPHTLFFYHNPDEVKNRTELPVRENQLMARSLIKSFTTAAAAARVKYGVDIQGDLPEPLTIQCVQADGKSFHFSVFQLNTINISGSEGKKNYWWSMPQMNLFDFAGYKAGRPVFEGYNPEVFQRILAFYKNA